MTIDIDHEKAEAYPVERVTEQRTCSMCHQQEDCLYGYVNSEPVCMYCWETTVDLIGGDYVVKDLVY